MEATAAQLEEALYEMVFCKVDKSFPEVDAQQLEKFRTRLVLNLESRLNGQFGASLALVEETFSLNSTEVTRLYMQSQEFSHYREDVAKTLQDGENTFEQCFLNFLLKNFGDSENFCQELEQIFLLELSAGLKS